MNTNKVGKIASFALMMMFSLSVFSQTENEDLMKYNHEIYEEVTNKMEIISGAWRPMFGSEQVVWISPPWESEEYIWLDFPETIWENGEILFLGHIDKRFPTKYPVEKSAPWTKIENGISYEQILPNGVSFGGTVTQKGENTASLEFWVVNGSSKELKNVMLQTCVYLNGIKEFDDNTNDNKYVHVPNKGWVPMMEAQKMKTFDGGFGVGWLVGPKNVSDLPLIITKSKVDGHLLGLTWFEDTYAFIGNEAHPCVHADPSIGNMKLGVKETINGEIIFFEGTMDEFEASFRKTWKK